MTETNVTRRELEISTEWAKNNPVLCRNSLQEFREETKDFKKQSVDTSREGFLTYIASNE